MKANPIETVERMLHEAMENKKISACALHMRDPCWPSYMRVVCAPGVWVPEADHGVPISLPVSLTGKLELYSSDARTQDPIQRPHCEQVKNLLAREEEKYQLFGNFIHRETVKSRAWFLHWQGDVIGAMLSLSYRHTTHVWEREEKQWLFELFHDRIVPLIPLIDAYLLRQSAHRFPSLIRIIAPIRSSGAASKDEQSRVPQKGAFDEILKAAVAAFDIKDDGFGTIHLLQPDGKVLIRIAECGQFDRSLPKVQPLEEGLGVVTWVALRKQPVVIGRLPDSKFNLIHVKARENINSEMAVPLLDGNKLLGVLNLECERPDHFRGQSVGILSHAATQLALAYTLEDAERRTQLATEVLRVSSDLPVVLHSQASNSWRDLPLNRLATIACDYLRVTHCDIWRRTDERFQPIAATFPISPDKGPRADGWTNHVYHNRRPVYISRAPDSDTYLAQQYDATTASWTAARPAIDILLAPPRLPKPSRAKLGLPIRIPSESGSCLGVAWFNCTTEENALTLRVLHSNAEAFIGPASLALAYLENDERTRHDAFSLLTRAFYHEGARVIYELRQRIQEAYSFATYGQSRDEWLAFLDYLHSYLEDLRWFQPGGAGRLGSLQITQRATINVTPLFLHAKKIATLTTNCREPDCELVRTEDSIDTMTGDYPRILLLLVNLLANAKLFTDDDKVEGTVFVFFERLIIDGRDGVRITVEDQTGRPVPPQFLSLLGRRIGFRGDYHGRTIEGTGFGLYLCRLIAEAHGGRMLPIEVHDGKHQYSGSSFRFFLANAEKTL